MFHACTHTHELVPPPRATAHIARTSLVIVLVGVNCILVIVFAVFVAVVLRVGVAAAYPESQF